jgi:hypothetical protein
MSTVSWFVWGKAVAWRSNTWLPGWGDPQLLQMNPVREGDTLWGSTRKNRCLLAPPKQDPHHNLQKILNLLMSATKQQLMPSASQVSRTDL